MSALPPNITMNRNRARPFYTGFRTPPASIRRYTGDACQGPGRSGVAEPEEWCFVPAEQELEAGQVGAEHCGVVGGVGDEAVQWGWSWTGSGPDRPPWYANDIRLGAGPVPPAAVRSHPPIAAGCALAQDHCQPTQVAPPQGSLRSEHTEQARQHAFIIRVELPISHAESAISSSTLEIVIAQRNSRWPSQSSREIRSVLERYP